MSAGVDEPGPYLLTGIAERATEVPCDDCNRTFPTVADLMAHRFGVRDRLRAASVPRGVLGGMLPAGPLLERVEAHGGLAACGGRQHSAEERAYYRARRDGWLTERAADLLAVRLLGLTTQEVWEV